MVSGVDRDAIAAALGLCPDSELNSEDDVWELIYWIADSISTMAAGSYSFPSSYMVGADGVLPAYPLRVACSHLSQPLEGVDLLKGDLSNLNRNATTV